LSLCTFSYEDHRERGKYDRYPVRQAANKYIDFFQLEGLEGLMKLRKLYLTRNRIQVLEGLHNNRNLQVGRYNQNLLKTERHFVIFYLVIFHTLLAEVEIFDSEIISSLHFCCGSNESRLLSEI
jgi:hypothetical protein